MRRLAAVPLIFALAAAAHAADPAEVRILRELGGINGQALACGRNDLVARIKARVAALAPKTRTHGAIFEEATQSAFLAQGRSIEPCPESAILGLKAEDALMRLQAAVPALQEAR